MKLFYRLSYESLNHQNNLQAKIQTASSGTHPNHVQHSLGMIIS